MVVGVSRYVMILRQAMSVGAGMVTDWKKMDSTALVYYYYLKSSPLCNIYF